MFKVLAMILALGAPPEFAVSTHTFPDKATCEAARPDITKHMLADFSGAKIVTVCVPADKLPAKPSFSGKRYDI